MLKMQQSDQKVSKGPNMTNVLRVAPNWNAILKNERTQKYYWWPLSFGLSSSLGAPAFEVCTLKLGQWKKIQNERGT